MKKPCVGWKFQTNKTHLLAFVLAGFASVGFSQASGTVARSQAGLPKLTYDVASIREAQINSAPGVTVSMNIDDPFHEARFDDNNMPLGWMIAAAYGLRGDQVIGGPDWINRTLFVVRARSDEAATETLKKLSDHQAEMVKRNMLQDLLATRFHLAAHTETREQTVYFLTISNEGPKLRASKLESTGDEKADAEKNAPSLSQNYDPRGWQIDAKHVSMTEITEFLKDSLSTDVIDKTGLSGKYDFALQFHGRQPGEENNGTTDWPPLTTAIQETLGLKVERGKGPVQVLVIDHAKKPTEN